MFQSGIVACALLAMAGSPVVQAESRAPQRNGFSRVEVGRIDRLLELIQKRLERAPELAAARWKSMSRIEDRASEQQLLEAARRRAAMLRLDPELAARFAQAQVDAAKIIQAERHKHWASAPAAAPGRDGIADPLKASTAEPELDASLLRAWRDALPVLRKPDAGAIVDARAADRIHVGGGDLLAAQVALKPLYEVAQRNGSGQ
jgi:chorismate mutase-like protein